MTTILVLLMSAMTSAIHAQSTFAYNGVRINSTRVPEDYTFEVNGATGLRLEAPESSSWLHVDLTQPGRCLISGKNDCINFYDPEYKSYVGVLARKFITTQSAAMVEAIDTTGVFSLRPVSFKWNQGFSNNTDLDEHYGFIAQEVENEFPDIVSVDADGTKMMDYTSIVPILVKALQSLEEIIEAQHQELEYLTRERKILNP